MESIKIRQIEAWMGTCGDYWRKLDVSRDDSAYVCRELFQAPTDSEQQRWRLVKLTDEEHEAIQKKIAKAKHYRPTIRGACYCGSGNRDHYVPFIYTPTGRTMNLPSIPYVVATMLFCDYVAECLHPMWKRGMFRYAWADPASEHPFFNLPKAARLRNQDSPIYTLAQELAVNLEDRVAPTNWVPEHKELRVALMALIEGKMEIKFSAAGRPKGSKNKSLATPRLNALEKRVAELERKLNFEEDINLKQTNNIQVLLEKLNELTMAYNKLLRVHRVFADENGTVHAEHQPWKVLQKRAEPPKTVADAKAVLKGANKAFDDTCRNPDGTPWERNTTEPVEEQEVKPEPTRERASEPAKKGSLFI